MKIQMLKRKQDSTEGGEKKGKVDEFATSVFSSFMNFELSDSLRDFLKETKRARTTNQRSFGSAEFTEYAGVQIEPSWDSKVTPESLGWTTKLQQTYKDLSDSSSSTAQGYLEVIGRYVDLQGVIPVGYFDHRNVYLAHILNHIIRNRNQVISNKKKLEALQTSGSLTDDDVEALRDQGFVRPIVLILCPFKKDAYDIIRRLKLLVFGNEKGDVWSHDRFEKEFSSPGQHEFHQGMDPEFKELLSGNNEDSFRLGVSLSKKALKLYEPFEKADILLCSPLGLRMILDGDEGKEGHLVSSLNIMIIDGADTMLQQNWEHLTLIMDQIHQQPSKIDVDISRVRQFYLDGNGAHYSQLMLFSKYPHELFSALIMGHSLNHRGLMVQQQLSTGTLDNIEIPLCQELHRFDVSEPSEQSDARFKYFKDNMTSYLLPHTCIVIPSYYDFVRLRNHFKRTEESFVACQEYSASKKIMRARDMFFHQRKNLMLVTERFYFFNRARIRGVEQFVFYQLPSHPKFYAEFINMAKLGDGKRLKAALLFCKFDRFRLQNTFGQEMAAGILSSQQRMQAIVSE